MLPFFTFWDHDVLHRMFVVGVPIAEKILRPIIVYVFLVVLLRIFGKRELAQLNPFDLIVLLSLSNTLQNAIIGDDTSVAGGLIGATTLCAFNYLVVRFLFRHRRLDQLVEGRPTVLMEDGRIVKKNVRKELMTHAEVLYLAHRQGFATLDEVDRIVLEPGGTFFIKGKVPRLAEQNHAEILARIEDLTRQVEHLRRLLADRGPEQSPGPSKPQV
jgi:uncharacterized membrane protein YcaP (DUF421 family)